MHAPHKLYRHLPVRKTYRDRLSNAATGAGDKCNLPSQVELFRYRFCHLELSLTMKRQLNCVASSMTETSLA